MVFKGSLKCVFKDGCWCVFLLSQEKKRDGSALTPPPHLDLPTQLICVLTFGANVLPWSARPERTLLWMRRQK